MLTTFDYCVICIPVLVIVGLICTLEYFKAKQIKEWNKIISGAKKELEESGILFNHSYELKNKENGNIRFLRIFEIKYNPNDKKVYCHVYLTTKNGEIGTWYDEYTYMTDIHNRWYLTDTGEWNSES